MFHSADDFGSSYGYSPHPLSSYLRWAADLLKADPSERKKPFILSLTGTADVLEATIVLVRKWAAIVTGADVNPSPVIAIEVNLSCPNVRRCLFLLHPACSWHAPWSRPRSRETKHRAGTTVPQSRHMS